MGPWATPRESKAKCSAGTLVDWRRLWVGARLGGKGSFVSGLETESRDQLQIWSVAYSHTYLQKIAAKRP